MGIGILAAILVLSGGVFYFLKGKSFVVRLSEAQLREKLEAKLPLTKTYFLFFQITLRHLRVTLVEGSDRVKAGLDVELNMRLGNASKALGGSVDVSGGIQYNAAQGELFMTHPVIEQTAVQGVPEKYAPMLNEALSKAIGEYCAERPLYALRATDTKQAIAKLVLKDVVVQDRHLVITLGI